MLESSAARPAAEGVTPGSGRTPRSRRGSRRVGQQRRQDLAELRNSRIPLRYALATAGRGGGGVARRAVRQFQVQLDPNGARARRDAARRGVRGATRTGQAGRTLELAATSTQCADAAKCAAWRTCAGALCVDARGAPPRWAADVARSLSGRRCSAGARARRDGGRWAVVVVMRRGEMPARDRGGEGGRGSRRPDDGVEVSPVERSALIEAASPPAPHADRGARDRLVRDLVFMLHARAR